MSNVHLEINHTSGSNSTTALHEAAFVGFEEGIALLLQHPEIDINVKDQLGQTPLHYAVQRNQMGSLRALLSAGARLDLACHHQRLPIHTAVMCGFEMCTRLLLGHRLCHANNPQELDLVMAREGTQDQSVLACAVIRGHRHNLRLLLDLKPAPSDTWTDLAIYWNRLDCLQSLLDSGHPISPNALLLAVQQRKIDLVRLLVEAGARPCLENGQNPAFLYAANHGFMEMIPLLFTLSTSRDCIQQALFLASSCGAHLKLKHTLALTVKTLLSKPSSRVA
ncbi:ankyrin repeat-containing domain protein [Sporodiniella umbellata]|nr:ankyrin repeat-containing domain protein [Sporodiniella umbellata]